MRPTSKDLAIKNWAPAAKLRMTSHLDKWLAVFPDARTLARFREETGGESFPEDDGQSPWEDAWTVARLVGDGFTDGETGWYRSQLVSITPHHVRETRLMLTLVFEYGRCLPDLLNRAIISSKL